MRSSLANTDSSIRRRDAALQFLDGRINYERDRAVPYGTQDLKLERMRELLARLGDPHQKLPLVHVAGTKGKGSTAAMVGAVLAAAGHRTGMFTSPHLDRLEERFAINGQPCLIDELVELVQCVRPAVEAMDRDTAWATDDGAGPTYFEIVTAMALFHFVRRGANLAVLEVGLGGRLDATNVCQPQVCAITSIGFDHIRQLGNSLESIAGEKAGIVKAGVPVVSGVTQRKPREVIRQICQEREAPLAELGVDFEYQYRPPRRLELGPTMGQFDFRSLATCPHVSYRDLALSLLGDHQAANAAVAMAVLSELERGGWAIPEQAIRRGLSEVVWPARVEVLARRPAIVLDSAHNASSAAALARVLEESFSARRRLLVFAASKGKDIRGMLSRLLEKFDEVVFTQYIDNPRSISPEELAARAAELKPGNYRICPRPADAWEEVRSLAGTDDLICVTGSMFIAAEMRQPILAHSAPLPTTTPAKNWQGAT